MEIREKVLELIADHMKIPREELDLDQRFVEDLGADSLEIMELIMELEDVFNLDIPEEKWRNLKTVGQAIEFVEVALNKHSVHFA